MKSKIKSTNLTEDHNIKLEEPGKGPGAGPIIEGPNNKVIEADDLIYSLAKEFSPTHKIGVNRSLSAVKTFLLITVSLSPK